MLIRTNIVETSQGLELRVTIMDVLARPVIGPDTIRFERTALDSVIAAKGAEYAKQLAK